MLAWALGCSSSRPGRGAPEGPQRTIPQPRLRAYRSGADVSPRRARASWGLGGSASPGQLSSEAQAGLLPHGAPGSWSLQFHSSLRPTLLMPLTAQMGGEATESSSKSREKTALLPSEALAKSGRVCVCVCTSPSLPPSLPSSEMLFNSPLPREPPSSILPLPQPSPAQPSPAQPRGTWASLWLPLLTQDLLFWAGGSGWGRKTEWVKMGVSSTVTGD